MTRCASGSATSASNKCSSVANSCLRSLANASAWWIAFSRVVENDGTALLLSSDVDN